MFESDNQKIDLSSAVIISFCIIYLYTLFSILWDSNFTEEEWRRVEDRPDTEQGSAIFRY